MKGINTTGQALQPARFQRFGGDLINILEYIGKIWKYTEDVNDADELFELNEQMNLNASLTLIANIGENVSRF